MAIFSTADCEDCAAVKRQWQEELTAPEDPVLIFLDIAHPPNYRCLEQIEAALKIPAKGASFPIFLVGNRLIDNIDAFYEQGDELFELATVQPSDPAVQAVTKPLATAAATASAPVVDLLCPEDASTPATTAAATTIVTPRLLYFFQKNCKKCSRQEKELELLLADLPELTIDRFDVAARWPAILRRAMNHFRLPTDDTRNCRQCSAGRMASSPVDWPTPLNSKPRRVTANLRDLLASARQRRGTASRKNLQQRRLGKGPSVSSSAPVLSTASTLRLRHLDLPAQLPAVPETAPPRHRPVGAFFCWASSDFTSCSASDCPFSSISSTEPPG